MNQAESLIRFYQAGFKVCLGLAILFLLLTIVLFFRFDIRRVIANRTGRAQRRSIEQMREANERTGHLRHAQKVASGEYTPISLNPGAGKTTEQKGGKNLPDSGNTVGETTPLLMQPSQEAVSTHRESGHPTQGKRKKASEAGKFVITKEILLIHTDEWI